MAAENQYFSTSLQKGLKILWLFNKETPSLTQSEISRTTGINMTSTYRFVNTLVRLGYLEKDAKTKELVDSVLGEFDAGVDALYSVLGRHAARALEAKLVGDVMVDWLQALKPGEPAIVESRIPDQAEGVGLTEGPRGALGHWMTIKDKKMQQGPNMMKHYMQGQWPTLAECNFMSGG